MQLQNTVDDVVGLSSAMEEYEIMEYNDMKIVFIHFCFNMVTG